MGKMSNYDLASWEKSLIFEKKISNLLSNFEPDFQKSLSNFEPKLKSQLLIKKLSVLKIYVH